ncbi:hypothetical protein JW835_04745 [bacterium]|nr:hypothetical protein [bacterium]RQV97216.1 MAG: hypothetical protein EH221_04060 [bacterium]
MEAKCPKTIRIIELLEENLSRHERKALETHIEQCETCRSFLEDFNQIDQVLTHHQRPKAPDHLITEYHQTMNRRFMPASRQAGRSRIRSFLLYPPPAMRFIQATLVLFIGVSIGWILFHKSSAGSQQHEAVVQITPYKALQIQTFFHESEIWLLDMMNLPQNGDLDIQDWKMTYDEAEQLLRKINIIREINDSVSDRRLQHYINGLEILLLEMINGKNEDHSGIVRQIRQTIIDLDMLFRVDMLKKRLPTAARQV